MQNKSLLILIALITIIFLKACFILPNLQAHDLKSIILSLICFLNSHLWIKHEKNVFNVELQAVRLDLFQSLRMFSSEQLR